MGQYKLPVSIKVGPYEPSVLMRFRGAWSYIEVTREFGRFFCVTTIIVTYVEDNSSARKLAKLPFRLERIRPHKSTHTVRPYKSVTWYGGLCIEPATKEQ